MNRLASSFAAAALALAAGALAMLAFHADPIAAYGALLQGALGSVQGTAETFVQTTPLLLTGLGVAVAFRAGLFNIGAEGQLVVGALCSAVFGAWVHLPTLAEIPLCFAVGAAAGGLWAAIAGWLRARFGASEIITTIMLNYIAFLGANYLVSGPLRGSNAAPETAPISPSAVLHPLVSGTRLTAAFPLALIAAAALAWWLRRTVAGYELRAVGQSERAARYAGVNVGPAIVRAMALSGALAGLAGSTEVLGLLHRFNAQLSPGYGFTSIAVALLANSSPLGVIVSAFFFGLLQNGALFMQAYAGVPKDLVSVVEGLVILFSAAGMLRSARGRARVAVGPEGGVGTAPT
ncbi:MAG: ABC transporter permease [Candidatus Eremiobacteraeota bacterium]|nr:ABC transporter permease [Candidatus Eremiobacteraeota bacterium]MBC5826550.1 ABC transporter permease [Candidatus Eremiobacteraeota bacterium]